MSSKWAEFWRNESGATAIEYGLIASLISITIIASTTTIGTTISDSFFDKVAAGLGGGGGAE